MQRIHSVGNRLSDFNVIPPTRQETDRITQKLEEAIHTGQYNFHSPAESVERETTPRTFLVDIFPHMKECTQAMVEDEFTKCFASTPVPRWNWNIYLYPLWLLGVVFRLAILFPIRALVLLIGAVIFTIGFTSISFVKNEAKKREYQRLLISFLCGVFVASWNGVIRFHGSLPDRRGDVICVANHTSMIDIIILQQSKCYSLVGQKHVGWVGFMQNYVLSCLDCIWFERSEEKDRAAVARRLREHLNHPDSNPILLFPEGTCVNNDYTVMFKKGAFELGGTVCPIAIKYDKSWADAFWNSRAESFQYHLFRLMTSWALVCDVYYLQPTTCGPNESHVDFANRVKAQISEAAGIKNTQWDGYLKYLRPSAKMVEARQKEYAEYAKSVYLHQPTMISTQDIDDIDGDRKLRHRPLRSIRESSDEPLSIK